MLVGGDENGRSQGGNNNGYCQDNEISWLSWSPDVIDQDLRDFTKRLLRLRRDHPVFRRPTFLAGAPTGSPLPDAWWFRPDGRKMSRQDWEDSTVRVGVFLNGDALNTRTANGRAIADDSFLVLFNASHESTSFKLPARRFGRDWTVEIATADPEATDSYTARGDVFVEARSMTVLRRGSSAKRGAG
jgi:glycogen operon protein